MVIAIKKRLVLYLGYDSRSAGIVKSIELYRDFFDEIRTIYVPISDSDTLNRLSLPSATIEELPT